MAKNALFYKWQRLGLIQSVQVMLVRLRGQYLKCVSRLPLQSFIKYIQMTQNDEKTQHQEGQLCPKCKDMYGHANFDFLCSQCYKKQKNISAALQETKPTDHPTQNQEKIATLPEPVTPSLKRELPKEEEKVELPKGKCTKCSKKTGMLGYTCKHCTLQFCKFHRLPEEHSCEVDFVALGRKKIKSENPVISLKKIEDI